MIVQHHSSKTTSKACCLQVHRKLSHKKKSRHECVRPWWTLLIIVSKTSWKVLSDIFARTFIRIKHRIRPSTEPVVHPLIKYFWRLTPFITVYFLQSLREFSDHLFGIPETRIVCKFFQKNIFFILFYWHVKRDVQFWSKDWGYTWIRFFKVQARDTIVKATEQHTQELR